MAKTDIENWAKFLTAPPKVKITNATGLPPCVPYARGDTTIKYEIIPGPGEGCEYIVAVSVADAFSILKLAHKKPVVIRGKKGERKIVGQIVVPDPALGTNECRAYLLTVNRRCNGGEPELVAAVLFDICTNCPKSVKSGKKTGSKSRAKA